MRLRAFGVNVLRGIVLCGLGVSGFSWGMGDYPGRCVNPLVYALSVDGKSSVEVCETNSVIVFEAGKVGVEHKAIVAYVDKRHVEYRLDNTEGDVIGRIELNQGDNVYVVYVRFTPEGDNRAEWDRFEFGESVPTFALDAGKVFWAEPSVWEASGLAKSEAL